MKNEYFMNETLQELLMVMKTYSGGTQLKYTVRHANLTQHHSARGGELIPHFSSLQLQNQSSKQAPGALSPFAAPALMTLTRDVDHGKGVEDGLDGVLGEAGEVVVGELEPLQRVKVHEGQRRDPGNAAGEREEIRQGRAK